MVDRNLVNVFQRMCDERVGCNDCPCADSKICSLDEEELTDADYQSGIEAMKKGNTGQLEFDVVERPAHYAKTSIECIDAMRETQGDEAVKQFCICNAFKYLWRHNSKNGDEDIKKANWYLNKAVEIMGKE